MGDHATTSDWAPGSQWAASRFDPWAVNLDALKSDSSHPPNIKYPRNGPNDVEIPY